MQGGLKPQPHRQTKRAS